MKTRHTSKSQNRQDTGRGRTKVPGQNPKANDSTDQDLYHDENRRNMYDPELGEELKLPKQKSKKK